MLKRHKQIILIILILGAMATSDEITPTTMDSMKDLDTQAAVTTTDKENVPKKSNIMFVRGETQSKSVLEAEKEPTVNPDAIDLDDDDSDEEDSEDQSDKDDNEPVAKKGDLEDEKEPTINPDATDLDDDDSDEEDREDPSDKNDDKSVAK